MKESDKMKKMYRTYYCGTISENDIGSEVRVAGWIENIRDHGGIIFVDVRDEKGIIQIVSNDDKIFSDLTRESSVTVLGVVRKRS
jgi:aspartyl-tRNA synthetase